MKRQELGAVEQPVKDPVHHLEAPAGAQVPDHHRLGVSLVDGEIGELLVAVLRQTQGDATEAAILQPGVGGQRRREDVVGARRHAAGAQPFGDRAARHPRRVGDEAERDPALTQRLDRARRPGDRRPVLVDRPVQVEEQTLGALAHQGTTSSDRTRDR